MLDPENDRPSAEDAAMALGKPERLILLVLTVLAGACADYADPSTGSAWTLRDDTGLYDADQGDVISIMSDTALGIDAETECSVYHKPGLAGLANLDHSRDGERFCGGDRVYELYTKEERGVRFARDTGENCCGFPIYDVAVPYSKVTALSYNAPAPPPRSETEGCAVLRRFDPDCQECWTLPGFEWTFHVEFTVTNLGDQSDYVDCRVSVDGPYVEDTSHNFYFLLQDELFAPGETRQVSETLTYSHFRCALDVSVSCKGENEPRVLNVFASADVPDDWKNQRVNALDPPLRD